MLKLEYASIPESWVTVLIGRGASLLFDALRLKQKCSCEVCILGQIPFLKSGRHYNIIYRDVKPNSLHLSLALEEIVTLFKDSVITIAHVDGQYVDPLRQFSKSLECKFMILDPKLQFFKTLI